MTCVCYIITSSSLKFDCAQLTQSVKAQGLPMSSISAASSGVDADWRYYDFVKAGEFKVGTVDERTH